jgi:DNA-binding transcriptional LysR family regulator
MDARPSWDDLHVFLAAARRGTLTAAAGDLRIDASTVHRRLARLERELGARLFDRSQAGYSLTSAGEELLRHVARIEDETLAIGRKIGGLDQGLRGTVRVSTVDDLACTLLAPIIAGFRREHPLVDVDLHVYNDHTNLARREADVAIRLGARPRDPDVVARHVCRLGLVVYGSRAYVRAHGRLRRLEDLPRHRVVLGDDTWNGNPIEEHVRRLAAGATVTFRSNSMLARLAAVRDGLGIGMLPCFSADRERSLVRLATVVRPEAPADLWLVTHVDLRRSARVRAFADFAYDALLAARKTIEA